MLPISRSAFSLKSPITALNSEELPRISDHHGRSLLWSEETDNSSTNTTKNVLPLPVCPMYVNQTESVRLALELHR